MGRPRAFLEVSRADPGYRPIEERIRDFRSVERQLDYVQLQNQSSRCMDCGTPFCHAYGCPLGNIIPEFNQLLYQGNWKKALKVLISTNNFPEFTGRVCPAPCEAACVAGLSTEPVTIRQIELAIIERGFEDGCFEERPKRENLAKRIAVVGAGPAGLAVADTLNKIGYNTVVYESAPKPGGILMYGIPDFKLEKWVVSRRIELMESQGVVFESGVRVGHDLSFRYLNNRFDAVCLACGAREPRDLEIPGRELGNIHFAMDYLTGHNLLIAGESETNVQVISARDKKVLVIGGGDTGSDCLGTALREGAKSVTQIEILPLPPSKRASYTPWPLWPSMLRQTHAHKEGGKLVWGVMAEEFQGDGGKVNSVRCVEVEWKRDSVGRPISPVQKPGSEFLIEADLVLLAMGFTGAGSKELALAEGLVVDQRGLVLVDPEGRTKREGIFAAGDMARGQSLVVKAIADGRRSAFAVDSFLKGRMKRCDRNS